MSELPPLTILYGSATGNAQSIAKDLAEIAASKLKNKSANNEYLDASQVFYSSVVCKELNAFKKLNHPNPFTDKGKTQYNPKLPLIIVTSTTGNGDPPENAGRFVRFIKKQKDAESMLDQIVYSVLALGDTNYDQFCATGHAVSKGLDKLGALKVKDIICADEATGLEDTVEPYMTSVLKEFATYYATAATSKKLLNGIDDTGSNEDEKKEDAVDNTIKTVPPSSNFIDTTAAATTTTTISPGVSALKLLASELFINENFQLPDVDPSSLVQMTSSLSSCSILSVEEKDALLQKNHDLSEILDDNMTGTSASTFLYKMNNPYESEIVSASYLTNTSNEPAKCISETLDNKNDTFEEARLHLEHSFPLLNNKSAEHNGKRVIHMELSLPEDFSLEYNPGDSIGVLVDNSPSDVQVVLDMLHRVHSVSGSDHCLLNDDGQPLTVQQVVKSHIDICTVVRKKALSALAQHATNLDESKALRLLASKTEYGEKLYKAFIEEQCLNIPDVLLAFPSCTPDLPALVGLLPAIAPRYYSVSSSPLSKPSSLTFAFSVVDYLTPVGSKEVAYAFPQFSQRRKHGVATQFLEIMASPLLAKTGKTPTSKIRIFPKPTQEFTLPTNSDVPLIMVGPGTGVAPFIGFLSHRSAQLKQVQEVEAQTSAGTWRGGYDLEGEENTDMSAIAKFRSNQKFGSIELFFGCRHQDHDWLYKNEMDEFIESGTLSKLHIAFSRDGDKKMYVQDKMLVEDEAQRLAKLLLEKNANVYICGDGNNMAKDVQDAFAKLLEKYGSVRDGHAYIKEMKDKKKLLLDIWS